MLRVERSQERDRDDTDMDVNVDSYEVWRAYKDVERLAFMFRATRQRPPAELERLQAWVRRMAAANSINLHSQ